MLKKNNKQKKENRNISIHILHTKNITQNHLRLKRSPFHKYNIKMFYTSTWKYNKPKKKRIFFSFFWLQQQKLFLLRIRLKLLLRVYKKKKKLWSKTNVYVIYLMRLSHINWWYLKYGLMINDNALQFIDIIFRLSENLI